MRTLLLALTLAGVVTAASAQQGEPLPKGPTETVGAVVGGKTATWTVEIADEPRERARGLMFRREMAPLTGMLFDFDEDERVAMWMRNTFIPLDMVFICADGTIAHVGRDTVPQSEAIVASGGPVRYVLEVNAGEAEKHGLRKGVKLTSETRFKGERGDCAP